VTSKGITLLMLMVMLKVMVIGKVLIGAEGVDERKEFYISTTGSDLNPGSSALPFATLERARDAIRDLKRGAEGLPTGGVTVWLREGTYQRTTSLILSGIDSGTADSPITYRAYPHETARLCGVTTLAQDGFVRVSDQAILARVISPEARAQLMQFDLAGHGLHDYGVMSRRGYGSSTLRKTAPVSLSIGGLPMMLARWPNPDQSFPDLLSYNDRKRTGVVARSGILDPGPTAEDPGYQQRGGTFSYAFDRPAKWLAAEDLWLDGVFSWSWEWSYNQVARIDPVKQTITLRYGESSGIKDVYSGNWFFAENLLEEIDVPGEYWIDRHKGLLYLLPNEGFRRHEPIQLTTLETDVISARGLAYTTFRDLHVSFGRGWAISLSQANKVRIEGCEIEHFSGGGISVHGNGCLVADCHIHDLGGNGIAVSGGDLEHLTPGDDRIEDCDIHDWGRFNRVYTAAIVVEGVGQKIRHNRLRYGPHAAILPRGNDHLIEYNEISDVCREFIDLGAIYINVGSKPLQRGWVIRRNHIHDIAADANGRLNVEGIYLDHGSSGGLIEENIFQRIGSNLRNSNSFAILASGLHTTVARNLFVDCSAPLRISAMPVPESYLRNRYEKYHWADYFREFARSSLPHVEKYPEILPLFPDGPVMTEKDMWNRFDNNIMWNPQTILKYPLGFKISEGNAKENPIIPLLSAGNWCVDRDPGFVDYAQGNLQFRSDGLLASKHPDFPRLRFADIGPRTTK
jgi:Right handed beta helix region